MSQENVDVVRQAFDAWNRGDHDALLRMWGEDAEFYPLRAQLEGRAYRGPDGLREFIDELDEEWTDVRFEVDEIRDAGEQMVGSGRFHGLTDAQREAMGREVNAVAADDATVLLDCFEPARLRPFWHGAGRSDVEAAFPGWKVTDAR